MNNTHEPGGDRLAGDNETHRDRQQGPYQESRHDHARGFDRDQAEQEARAAIGNARDELQSLLENQKNAAAVQVRSVAQALRGTADTLHEQDQSTVAAYVTHVADRIDYWSHRLRERHIEELGRDIQNLASRQPALFIAGAIVMGFAATRFIKSTSTNGDRSATQGSPDFPPTDPSTAATTSPERGVSADNTHSAPPASSPAPGHGGPASPDASNH